MISLKENVDVAGSVVKEEVKGFAKKKDIVKPTLEEQKVQPTFIQIEEPILKRNTLMIYNANPAYAYKWCADSEVSNGRSGNWRVVDRNHPDFKGLRVEIDEQPKQSFFKYRDLILCCMRKETNMKIKEILHQKTKSRSTAITNKYKENVGKIQKSLGNQSEAIRLMEEINEEG